MAESKTNKFCYVITATYGRGRVGESLHERAIILTYSDCQKFTKLLRRHGYEFRFFITGEYGSEYGRAHWNIIVYTDKPLPAFAGWDQYGRWTPKARYKQRFNWARTNAEGEPVYLQSGEPAWWWPHGFVYIEPLTVGSVNYVCKYVLKDFDGSGRQGQKAASKDPPLGTKWFQQIAEKYVEQGLAPQTPEYRFPEARTKEGVIIDFWLKGRPLELYLQHYLDTWAARNGDRPHPPSEMLELFQQYGRVINDEARMLARLENPSGMIMQAMPTREQVATGYERVRYERAVKEYERNLDGLRLWYTTWINEARDGEERQRRQAQCDDDLSKQWQALHAKWGREWIDGQGWKLRPGCPRSGEQSEQLHADSAEPVAPASPSGNEPDYGLGKVGRWNRDYRT